jgi:hypothetical protein
LVSVLLIPALVLLMASAAAAAHPVVLPAASEGVASSRLSSSSPSRFVLPVLLLGDDVFMVKHFAKFAKIRKHENLLQSNTVESTNNEKNLLFKIILILK